MATDADKSNSGASGDADIGRGYRQSRLSTLHREIWSQRKHFLETLVAVGAIVGTVTGTVAWLETRHVGLSLSAETQDGYYVSGRQLVPQDIALAVVNGSSDAVNLLKNGQVSSMTSRLGGPLL
jgi:hypothetical protein